jgi:predicted tellurium resistance membrane protein TerC
LDKPFQSVTYQAVIGLAALVVILWLALFLPAWSLEYWQAWTYWFVFVVCVTSVSVYFLKKDLKLIENLLKAGPAAEKERSQKSTQSFAALFFILLILIPPLDHRFQWSDVPVYLVLAEDVFVVLGFLIVFLSLKRTATPPALLK